MPERSSVNVHKIYIRFSFILRTKINCLIVACRSLVYIFSSRCNGSFHGFYFQLLTCTSYGKSVDTAEKSALKFVNLPSLKVRLLNERRYSSTKVRKFTDVLWGGSQIWSPWGGSLLPEASFPWHSEGGEKRPLLVGNPTWGEGGSFASY